VLNAPRALLRNGAESFREIDCGHRLVQRAENDGRQRSAPKSQSAVEFAVELVVAVDLVMVDPFFDRDRDCDKEAFESVAVETRVLARLASGPATCITTSPATAPARRAR
jgi:hypothetical protein